MITLIICIFKNGVYVLHLFIYVLKFFIHESEENIAFQSFLCYYDNRKVKDVALCYKKLWKLLIDRGMNKTDLRLLTGISQATLAKLSKGENVNTDVLERICKALKCEISDIVEYNNSEDLYGE